MLEYGLVPLCISSWTLLSSSCIAAPIRARSLTLVVACHERFRPHAKLLINCFHRKEAIVADVRVTGRSGARYPRKGETFLTICLPQKGETCEVGMKEELAILKEENGWFLLSRSSSRLNFSRATK